MTVRFSAPGVLPGTDFRRAAELVASEVGEPHAGSLMELPARGLHASLLGRATAQLAELYAELTAYGWRLVQRPGVDHSRAVSLLSSDVDTLADVRGERAETLQGGWNTVKVEVLGPVSAAAQLHLPGGEKVLIDHGARRDLAESLAAGLMSHLDHVRRSTAAQQIHMTVLEPDYARVRSGAVPTASGYQTIRSLPRDETRALLQPVVSALRTAGADQVILNLGAAVQAEHVEDFHGPQGSVDGFTLPVPTAAAEDWERAAHLVEAGAVLQASLLGADELTSPGSGLAQVTQLTDRLAQPWKRLGMPAQSLQAFTVTAIGAAHRGRMAQLSEPSAMAVITRLLGTAEALTDLAHQ